MEHIVFHIGSPKTGTSVIQSHMAQNRAVLRKKGVFYPVTESSDYRLYKTHESHHLLTYALAGWQPFDRFKPEMFFQRAEEMGTKHNLHTMLLSAENTFWLPTNIVVGTIPSEDSYWEAKYKYIKNIHQYFKAYDTKIVIYLRRQDRWLESWYNQQVKNGNHLPSDLLEFSEKQHFLLDYESQLNSWAEIFGKSNLIVRSYEKEQLPDGVVTDFLNILNLGALQEYPLHQQPRYNAQLNRNALEFINLCNALNLEKNDSYKLRLLVREITNQFQSDLIFSNQSLLSLEKRKKIVGRYDEMNKRIARGFQEKKHNLFIEDIEVSSGIWEEYQGINSEALLELLVPLIIKWQQHKSKKPIKESLVKLLNQSKQNLDIILENNFSGYRNFQDKRLWDKISWKD